MLFRIILFLCNHAWIKPLSIFLPKKQDKYTFNKKYPFKGKFSGNELFIQKKVKIICKECLSLRKNKTHQDE